MKNLPALALLFAATALTPLVSLAQDSSTPTPTPTAPADGSQPQPGHNGQRRRGGGPFNLKDLTAKLGLTTDQQKTIGDIINTFRGEMKEVHEDDSIAEDDKRAKMKELFMNERAQIREALTPDQQKTFDAMPMRGGPGGPPPPAAAPTPTPPPTT